MKKIKFTEITKCIITGCTNKSNQGVFIGDFCKPCYDYLAHNEGNNSQAERNELEIINIRKNLRKENNGY